MKVIFSFMKCEGIEYPSILVRIKIQIVFNSHCHMNVIKKFIDHNTKTKIYG